MSDLSEGKEGESKAVVPSIGSLPPDLKRIVEQVAEKQGIPPVESQKLEQVILAVMTKISFSYRQGPLPPFQELAGYESVLPGAANRIVTASENQAQHRMSLELQTVTSQNKQSERGQLYGFIIALIGFLCAFVAIETGHAIAGSVIGSIDLVALVSVFVLGKNAQKSDLAKKSKAVPEQKKES